jgi:hypothetical protein
MVKIEDATEFENGRLHDFVAWAGKLKEQEQAV